MTDPKDRNFDWLIERMVEAGAKLEVQRYEQSFHQLDRPTRRRRIKIIKRLSHALVEIEAKTIQGTALADSILEDVILGDIRAALAFALELQKDGDLPHLEPFFKILEELASAPTEEQH